MNLIKLLFENVEFSETEKQEILSFFENDIDDLKKYTNTLKRNQNNKNIKIFKKDVSYYTEYGKEIKRAELKIKTIIGSNFDSFLKIQVTFLKNEKNEIFLMKNTFNKDKLSKEKIETIKNYLV